MEFMTHPSQQEFNRLYKEMDDLYHEAALSLDLSDSALTILYTVCELGGGCLQKDICERSFLTKQTVHSSVRKLERDGFLRLESGKGRDMHLFLTEQGRALAEKTVLPLSKAEYLALDALTPQEQSELIRLTEKYLAALRAQMRQF